MNLKDILSATYIALSKLSKSKLLKALQSLREKYVELENTDFAKLFPLWASGYASGFDPTGRSSSYDPTRLGFAFSFDPTGWESRRTSDSALLRVRSKELRLHPQTPPLCGMKLLILFCKGAPLDSEALRFCNVRPLSGFF